MAICSRRDPYAPGPHHSLHFPVSVAKNSLGFCGKACEKTAKNGGNSEIRARKFPNKTPKRRELPQEKGGMRKWRTSGGLQSRRHGLNIRISRDLSKSGSGENEMDSSQEQNRLRC